MKEMSNSEIKKIYGGDGFFTTIGKGVGFVLGALSEGWSNIYG